MIDRFAGEYAWLSNFSPCYVWLDGEEYGSVEHAYQAAKTLHLPKRRVFQEMITAGRAKRLGRTLPLRADWTDVKLEVMLDLLRQKFTRNDLRIMLLGTGSHQLVEGNTWGDRFWGQCPVGVGENWLGRLLMQVREELRG